MKYLYLLLALVLLTGCTQSIDAVKSEDNIGKTVTVSGTVENRISLGSLSGYTVTDDSGSIGVSSQALPAEGDSVRVRGVLVRDTFLGYYIRTEE